MKFVQQNFCDATNKQFFTKSLSVKGLDDLALQWDISKTHFSG